MKRIIPVITIMLFLFSCNEVSVLKVNLKPDFRFKAKTSLGILPLNSSVIDVGSSISDSIGASLMQLDMRIIERTYLDNVLREQGLFLSGATESLNYNKIGKIVNVDYLLVGTAVTIRKRINQLSYTTSVSVRIVNVATGETVVSCNYAVKEEQLMLYPSLLGEEIAKGIIAELNRT